MSYVQMYSDSVYVLSTNGSGFCICPMYKWIRILYMSYVQIDPDSGAVLCINVTVQ